MLAKAPEALGLENGVRLFDQVGDIRAAGWGTSVSAQVGGDSDT